MSDYGIKVTLPGSDDIVYDMTKKVLKVQTGASPAHSATFSYTFSSEPGNGTLNIRTIAHGYSYAPLALMFWSTDNVKFYLMPAYFNTDFTFGGRMQFKYYTNSTNLVVDFIRTATTTASVNGLTYYFKYYITTEDGITN